MTREPGSYQAGLLWSNKYLHLLQKLQKVGRFLEDTSNY